MKSLAGRLAQRNANRSETPGLILSIDSESLLMRGFCFFGGEHLFSSWPGGGDKVGVYLFFVCAMYALFSLTL